MKLELFLTLGRVSNLPTVWSNVLAATALSGASASRSPTLALALSCFYIGGMFLNDAFDASYDKEHRPERPIPSGQVSQLSVFLWGGGLIVLGLLGLAFDILVMGGETRDQSDAAQNLGPALLSGLVLAGFIVLYNAWHKNNPLSPFLMGACRVGVYTTAALALTRELPPALLWGSLGLMSYLIGLTYAAKQENLRVMSQSWPLLFLLGPLLLPWFLVDYGPAKLVLFPFWLLLAAWLGRAYRLLCPKKGDSPQIPQAVGALIAGIALWDALLCAAAGSGISALMALACFGFTLLGHRRIKGT